MVRLSLRQKILFAVIALIVGLTVTALFVINVQVRSQIEANALKDFASIRHSFRNFLHLRGQQLIESCLLISRYPSFVDPVVRKDPENVRLIVIDLMSEVRADLCVVTDERGEVLGRFQSDKRGDNIGHIPSVKLALAGGTADSVDIWVEEGQLYVVATTYVLIPGRNFVAGTISLGQKLIDFDAEELAKATGADISFILNNNVVASSMDELHRDDLIKLYVNNKESIEGATKRGDAFSGESTIGSEEFFTTFGQIVQERPAFYAISLPLAPQLQSLRTIQQVIFLVGAGGIIIALMIAYVVAKNITSPISSLVEATEKVREGHYDFQLKRTTNDEIGVLADSFNSMIVGLRERSLMQKFVSTSTLEMIHKSQNDNPVLGGERRIVTVMFSDIRGFTAFSERVSPEQVIELLNLYLSAQARIIAAHGGVIDKFVGDEVVAIYEGENMVDGAVESAVDIQRELQALEAAAGENLKVGIGINTGMVVLGNVGSEERMDHTVLGSNVNLGSRLCAMANPGQIILSESSFRLLKTNVTTRPLEAIPVKGISLPVRTFEVLYDVTQPKQPQAQFASQGGER